MEWKFNENSPLGLPPGSIRGVAFLALIFGVIYYAYFDVSVRSVLSDLAKFGMGFYFAKKVEGK